MQMRVGVHFEYRSRSKKSRLEWSMGDAWLPILLNLKLILFDDFVVPKQINNAREINVVHVLYMFLCEFYCSHHFPTKLPNYIIITILLSSHIFTVKIRIPLFFVSAINNSHIYICILYMREDNLNKHVSLLTCLL